MQGYNFFRNGEIIRGDASENGDFQRGKQRLQVMNDFFQLCIFGSRSHMVKVRGDIVYFPSEDGPWRVRFLCRVIQIVGAVGFYSDVVLEKWNASGDLWKPVTMSQKPVKNSARIHLRFRCSGLSPSHILFHDFVYFCKLGRPLTAAKWKQWRDHCVINDLDVDHQGQNWRRAIRAELKLEKAGINRAMNARH